MSINIKRFCYFVIPIFVIVFMLILWRKNENNYLLNVVSYSELGVYSNAAVSTDASECAPLGKNILKKNGTAIDAAITTLLCMGIVIPHSMGLGGGSFLTYYDRSTQKSYVYDGREIAPNHVKTSVFNKTNLQIGPLSVAIPGELKVYYQAHLDHGKLSWSELFEEPIKLARRGVRVNNHLAKKLDDEKNKIKSSSLRKVFTNEKTGEVLKEGDILIRNDLADTYEKLAKSDDPISLFYKGEFTDIFVEELKGSGITKEDFEKYNLVKNDPFEFDLDENNRMIASTLPSSGILLGFMTKIISEIKTRLIKPNMEKSLDQTAAFYHQLIEIMKHVYSRRFVIADPFYEPELSKKLIDNLTRIDKTDLNSYFMNVINEINLEPTHNQSFYGAENFFMNDHGTAHASVIDQYGNAVSVTSTVNIYFGSYILSKTGIIFNDENDDFSIPSVENFFKLPPSKINRIEPYKRPASSMCPVIIIDKKTNDVKITIGGAGGSLTISGLTIALLRMLYMDNNIKEAIDQYRIHHQLYPDYIEYEAGFNEEIIDILKKKYGHESVKLKKNSRRSILSGISRCENNKLCANTDFRKGGSIAGF